MSGAGTLHLLHSPDSGPVDSVLASHLTVGTWNPGSLCEAFGFYTGSEESYSGTHICMTSGFLKIYFFFFLYFYFYSYFCPLSHFPGPVFSLYYLTVWVGVGLLNC